MMGSNDANTFVMRDKDKKEKPSKPTIKKLRDSQKHLNVARARGIWTKEISCFHHLINNKLSEEDLTVKPDKRELVKELEKRLTSSDYNFTSESHLRTAVDFISLIQRYPTSKLKTFNDLFSTATYSILNVPCVDDIDIVYDSYLEDSIKECKQICRRCSCEPLEFINLKTATPIPVQMDRQPRHRRSLDYIWN